MELAKVLPECTALVSLSLDRNLIRAKGAVALAKGLPKLLVSLSLADNNLTDYGQDMSGVIALAAALKDSQVVNLNLNGNHLEAQEAEELAKALPCCKALASLSLDDNKLCGIDRNGFGTFTTEGITALCDGIKQSKVSSLSVQDNNLDESSKQLLREAAPNVTITC